MNNGVERLPWSARVLRLLDLMVFRVQAWVFTRRLVLLIQGLPALLLAVALAAVGILNPHGPDRNLITRYELAVEQALQRDDPVSAKVFVRKLVLLDEPGPRTRYALASLAQYEGDLGRAMRLMSDLAPYPGSGWPAAHSWVAQRLLEEPPADADEGRNRRDETIHHLKQSLRLPAFRSQAQELLAQLYLEKDDMLQAAKYLEEVAPQRPELYLTLVQVLQRRQEGIRSQRAIRQARDHFQSHVAANPSDLSARVSWARVCRLDGKLDEAEQILLDGLAAGDDTALREALAETYLEMADGRETSSERELSRTLDLLTKALQTAPNHPAVASRLAMFLRYSGTPGEVLQGRLRDLLATGQSPATIHLLVGSSAVAEGRWSEARQHLEQAYRLDCRLPALLNQLAWALANGENPELDRALRLAETAVKLSPNQPQTRATRGRILARLQRWHESLTDLEAVLASGIEQAELHADLADVYMALDVPEMAQRHRALSAGGKHQPSGTEGP